MKRGREGGGGGGGERGKCKHAQQTLTLPVTKRPPVQEHLRGTCVYSCFEKGCPTEKHQSVRDNTERHDGLWLFAVVSSSSRVFSAMEGGVMNTCLRVLKRNNMDSELLTCFFF